MKGVKLPVLRYLVNFIIRIYTQSDTICSFVEPSLTTDSTESSDFGNDEIHSTEQNISQGGRKTCQF